MTKPTLHLNGTSREELCRQYVKARDALDLARRAMKESCPNGRDYYPQGAAAMDGAVGEHMARMSRLSDLIAEFNELITHCDGD